MKNYLSQSFKQSDFAHTESFEVREHTAMILSDPCYKQGIMDLIREGEQSSFPVEGSALGAYFPRMKKGTYRVEIQTLPGSKRTASWICKHQGTSTYETEIGLDIPVDSGQVGLFFAHSAYQAEAIPEDEIQLKTIESGWGELHPWYAYMCTTSLNYFYKNEMGICTDSGYGDGCYSACAYINEEEEVVAIEITFVEPCLHCHQYDDDCTCSEFCESCDNPIDDCTCDNEWDWD